MRLVAMLVGIVAALLAGQGIAAADSGDAASREVGSAAAASDPDPSGGPAADAAPARPPAPSPDGSGAGASPARRAADPPPMRVAALQVTPVKRPPRTVLPRTAQPRPERATSRSQRAGWPAPKLHRGDAPLTDRAERVVTELTGRVQQLATRVSSGEQVVAPAAPRAKTGAQAPGHADAPDHTAIGDQTVGGGVESAAPMTDAPASASVRVLTESATAPVKPQPVNLIGSLLFTALAGVVRVFDPPPVIPPGSTVTRNTSTLAVPCGCGQELEADWYFPNQSEEPVGVIYLQHGFFRSKNNVSALAVQLSERTNSVVVVPTVSSNPFAADGCWINGDSMHRGVAALFDGDRTALTGSATSARGSPVVLPSQFVIAGHSAGGNLAAAAAGYLTTGEAIADLRAVVMFDGVDSGGAIATAAGRLSGEYERPIYQIAGECSACNAFGSGTAALVDARPGQFVGVELKGGTHVDAEGPSAGLLAYLACGFPLPRNVDAVPAIAAGWINDVFTGSDSGVYGEAGQRIHVGGATAVVLGSAPVPVSAAA